MILLLLIVCLSLIRLKLIVYISIIIILITCFLIFSTLLYRDGLVRFHLVCTIAENDFDFNEAYQLFVSRVNSNTLCLTVKRNPGLLLWSEQDLYCNLIVIWVCGFRQKYCLFLIYVDLSKHLIYRV